MRITKEKLVEIIKEELEGLDESVLGSDDWEGSRAVQIGAILRKFLQEHPDLAYIYYNKPTGRGPGQKVRSASGKEFKKADLVAIAEETIAKLITVIETSMQDVVNQLK